MKIAWLNMYGGMVNRGAEVIIDELAKRIAKEHEVTVFQGGEGGSSYSAVKIPGVKWLTTDVESSYVNKLLRYVYLDPHSREVSKFTKHALRSLKKQTWDVIIPSDGGWEAVQVCKISKRLNAKSVILGLAGRGYDDWWNINQKPDLFVALSPAALDWANKVSSQLNSVYIPPGVNLASFIPDGEALELKLEKPIILCVAALVPYKRINLAIDAVSSLLTGSLLVVGEGPMQEELESYGRKKLKERFLLTHYAHSQMPKVFRSADLFTLPSRSTEAFGVAYLEALASNLPVVAPDDPNRREIVGEAGELTKVEDIIAYADSIEKALQKDYGKLPRHQAQKFDWEKSAVQFNQALKQCVLV